MREGSARYRFLLAAAVLLSAHGAQAQILYMCSVDRKVAAVGESFLVTVEATATQVAEAEFDTLKSVFERVRLDVDPADFEVIRNLRLRAERTEVGAFDVLHLTRRFIVRARRPGPQEIASDALRVGAREYSAGTQKMMVYSRSVPINAAKRSILPLIVETPIETRPEHFIGYGSSFLIAEDALVTAYHVVVNAKSIKTQLPNGKKLTLKKAWAIDPLRDVAILEIDREEVRKSGLKPLEIAPRAFEHGSLRLTGESTIVFTAGWPEGVQRTQAGILYGVDQFYDDEAIWLSSNHVRPGDSGGPLLDERGRVIGVISYAMAGHRKNAVPLENVATSTDPRPAMAVRLLKESPEGIGRYRQEHFFERNPHAMAAKVAALIAEFENPRERAFIGSVDPFLHDLDLAVTGQPDEARLHFLQGSVYQMLGEYPEASVAYGEALERRSRHYPAAYSLAYCQLALRSYEKAAELFDFITQFEPYEDLALYGLAQAEIQLLDYPHAIRHLQTVISDHPNFAPGLYLLGRAYLGLGNEALAAQILVKLKSTDSNWANLMDKTLTIPSFRPLQRYRMPATDVPDIERGHARSHN